ncbi:MAG: disulfide bond formation protein B [Bacteroidales bacterium]
MQTTSTATRRQGAVYTILALAVLALAAVPVGVAVFVLGFVYGDSPCVMCWEQRVGMALVALVGLFILRFGPRPKYIGLAILVGAWGTFMGARHVGMHAARDIGQGFSAEILGAHTYTWAIFIFWVSIVTMGVLLMMLEEGERLTVPRVLRPLEKIAMVVFLVVIAGNIVQAFASTGPPPYMGQGDPVRFSFNPKHWFWTMDEWSPAPISWRGRWAAEKPNLRGLPSDAQGGVFEAAPALPVKEQKTLSLPLNGTITDLAYDAASDRFVATTQQGIYILDGALQQVLRYTIVDVGYSVDLGRFAGTAFLDSKTVVAVGENKSYVVEREDDKANASENFKFFLESFDKFTEVSRSRFGTVRARMMYTLSLAFDPATKMLYTVTVPNTKSKRLVVSRFDRKDMTLSEEYTPVVAPGSGVKLRDKRSLDELYVVGAAVDNGRLYALSAAYNVIVTIDLATHQVVAARSVAGLSRPTGLAIKHDAFVVPTEDGKVWMVGRE